ncbi:transcriptional repressor LexA [Streptomyces sp. NPDC086796]|uniref:transcriptional repressor LexA n=1 Tax=Streptomyces sp. NPDC086796 TaxID=3365760 RepID=UPI00382BEB88
MHDAAGRPGRPNLIQGGTEALTDRQRRVLEAIQDHIEQRGYPPSMRQIGEAVGLASTSAVSYQLSRLEEMGLVGKDPRRTRAYRLLAGGLEGASGEEHPSCEERADLTPPLSVTAPVLGRIAAGAPNLAEEEVTDILTLPLQVVGGGDLFVLAVTGDSMAGNGSILDGDLVVVRRQPDAENGDVVAAMIDGEATVKRFRRADGAVWLLPDNPAYDPISGADATVLGKVTAILRSL